MFSNLTVLALLALSLLAAPGNAASPPATPAAATAATAKAPLTVESIAILPADPGPDTLCQLRVKVKNAGPRKVSGLAFAVRVNGEALAVYRHQIYLQPIEPGTTAEVRLFNFWTTETGRPMPKDGRLRVEVSLAEARWVEIKSEGGTESVTLGENVPGLPVSASLTVPLKAAAAKKPA